MTMNIHAALETRSVASDRKRNHDRRRTRRWILHATLLAAVCGLLWRQTRPKVAAEKQGRPPVALKVPANEPDFATLYTTPVTIAARREHEGFDSKVLPTRRRSFGLAEARARCWTSGRCRDFRTC